jgi:hypothetical protein
MTSLNTIIDAIGDTIFSPTVTTNNRNRLEQVLYDKEKEKEKFEDTLSNELKKYSDNYNLKRKTLRQALVNRKVLKIKTDENTKLIDTLVNEIKSLNYKPNENDVEDELTLLLDI